MAEYHVGVIKRAGEEIGLRVDDDGNWLTLAANRELKAPTRAKLITEIDRALRLEKKAVHIPFTYMQSKNNGYVTLKHGIVTGIHSGTGNLLVSWDDGSNGQITVGSSTTVLQRLTEGEERELALLAKEANDSSEALRGFTNRKHVYKGTKGLADQVQAILEKGDK